MEKVRIVIADGSRVFRTSFVHFLNRSQDLTVIAEADSGLSAVELVKLHRPDLLIMDSNLPRLGGYETAKFIRAELPETKVVIITMWEDWEHRKKAARAGAVGFITKTMRTSEILNAIEAANRQP